MCFTVSIYADTHVIETDFGSVFDEPEAYTPYFHVTGFAHPVLPMITGEQPEAVQMLEWGLIPKWVKNKESALDLANKTLNARSDTIFEKPSFREAIVKRRSLLPVNGFVEWRHEGTVAIPYMIRAADRSMLSLGCIWEEWHDRQSGEVSKTFSIVTTEANDLMSWVHNNKLRMPVVVQRSQRKEWLANIDRDHITRLMRPLPEGILEAAPLHKDVSRIKVNDTSQDVIEPIGEWMNEPPA